MTYFTPEILNSQQKFNVFLNPQKELQEIKKRIDNDSIRIPTKDHYYFGRWKVVWIIVTTPFLYITALFLEIIREGLTKICITRFNSYLDLLSGYLLQDITYLKAQWKFGKRLIAPTRNQHQLSSSDIHRQSPIKREDCSLAKTFPNIPDSLKFYSPEGVCAGASIWFNLLCLNILKKYGAKFSQKMDMSESKAYKKGYIPRFVSHQELLSQSKFEKISRWKRFFSSHSDIEYRKKKKNLIEKAKNLEFYLSPRGYVVSDVKNTIDKLIASVAYLFYSGIPRQGALLQTLQLEVISNILPIQDYKLRFHASFESLSNKDIENLPSGIYYVSVGRHAVSYLKFENKQYIWDSVCGLILMENKNQVIEHLKKIKDNYKNNILHIPDYNSHAESYRFYCFQPR